MLVQKSNNKKKVIYLKKQILMLTVSLLVIFSATSSSFAASKRCDNDPATSGCTDSYSGTFNLITHGASVSNDFRIQYSRDWNTGSYYRWNVNTGVSYSSRTGMDYEVHLNTVYATATVDYYVDGIYVSTINQDTAPGGWNSIGSGTNYGTVYMKLDATDAWNDTVADAVRISW
ncbi:hypothetical protein [Marinicrinis sediminis]|uniref:Spore coat protein U domain-containing protein n=1 Tax=Marinicrinis sediminis TaxID=1652465 RepID=A0ABW5RG03_9BACL